MQWSSLDIQGGAPCRVQKDRLSMIWNACVWHQTACGWWATLVTPPCSGISFVVDNSTLTLKGIVTNAGTIALQSTGDLTELAIGSNVTLTGSGKVMLADVAPAILGGSTNAILAAGATASVPFTLTNANNTISGAGAIGNGDKTLKLVNQAGATIDATGTNPLTIDTGNTVTNTGLMEATGVGSSLIVDDAVSNTGTILANGGNVTITGNLSGAGKVQIASADEIELKGGANTGAVNFLNGAGDTGALILDLAAKHGLAAGFTGTVAGFEFDGTSSDTLDLQDIKFASASWSFKENAADTQGVLTVKDTAGDVANITLMGQYLAANASATSASGSTLFNLAADTLTNTTGTLVTTTHL
jgi:hypothetical protein